MSILLARWQHFLLRSIGTVHGVDIRTNGEKRQNAELLTTADNGEGGIHGRPMFVPFHLQLGNLAR